MKPQGKAPDVAQREVDEAMRKVRQASHSITNVIEPGERERESEGRVQLLMSLSQVRERGGVREGFNIPVAGVNKNEEKEKRSRSR